MSDYEGGASVRIKAEVGSWEGVEVGPHRFGGIEFRLGRRELGHVHGDQIADLPFPRRVRLSYERADRARRSRQSADGPRASDA